MVRRTTTSSHFYRCPFSFLTVVILLSMLLPKALALARAGCKGRVGCIAPSQSRIVSSNLLLRTMNRLHYSYSYNSASSMGHTTSRQRLFATLAQKDQAANESGLPAVRPDFDKEAESKYFAYDQLERSIYEWWEREGYFKPSEDTSKEPFVIPMPPPNVTGYLHMGHAMFVALQDIMARFHRMRGKATLWLPGTDHAGIATQLLVERAIIAEGGSRQAMGREKFLERVWSWKEEKGGYITGQMRRLGASADWSREKFTLEPQMSSSVTEAFVKLHERGLVYKGDYMVNWSPNLQTAVSDLEVEYSEEVGKLYTFKYVLSDGSGFIPVATTRPETIIGDTAVCVHPEDDRYKAFIGKTVKVPMFDRAVPVIADDYVDRDFGTGALKITPAHDQNDYELAKRHSLPLIKIMNKDASINSQGGDRYEGLDRFVCRERIWADMAEQGLVIKAEPHTQRVPRSQRGGEVIEPMVSGQWFVKMDNMASRAVEAVKSKEIAIIPDRFEKVWFNWLENIHDWCISRQLWWGHRIPAYYIEGSSTGAYVVARSEEEAYAVARAEHGPAVRLVQDEDVLDTWFSSGLWPFATVGWPEASNAPAHSDFQRFYPAHVMETGYDILFFWVARMVMMAYEFTDKAPFHTIYMHGLVRDGEGQKMSKTKGNVIDPIDTIEKYGCDALRYSLVTGCTPGQDVPLSMEKVEANRNFANKLWNAGKYLQNALSKLTPQEKADLAVTGPMELGEMAGLPLAERYIVSRCHELASRVTDLLEGYNFGEAGRQIYEFIWDEYADWYIEISKTRSGDEVKAAAARRTLVYVWDSCLRLLHPYMPFLTEALWQAAPHRGDSIMMAEWPLMASKGGVATTLAVDAAAVADFESLRAVVRSIRNARAEYNVEAGKKIAAVVRCTNPNLLAQLAGERAAISLLAKVDDAQLVIESPSTGTATTPSGAVHLIVQEGLEVFLPTSGMIDYAKEIVRLTKQAEKLQKDISTLETRLASPGYLDKAPEKLVAEVRASIADKKEQVATVERSVGEMRANIKQ